MIEKNKEVWEKMKSRGFELKFSSDFIYIIENNLDRIRFVTDLIGLRDVVMVTEKGCDPYFNDHFILGLDVDADKSRNFDENKELLYEKMETRELIGMNRIEVFFKKTNRNLCLFFNSKESSRYDNKKVMAAITTSPPKSTELILKQTREFPEWYREVAKDPEDIVFIPKSVEQFISKYLGSSYKQSMIQRIKHMRDSQINLSYRKKILNELELELENIS